MDVDRFPVNGKESVVVESATKAPKAKKVCLTPKVAKVTPPKLDVPTNARLSVLMTPVAKRLGQNRE